MFKEYDKNTYKEKKLKDRTPIRNGFKKTWNNTAFWRCLVFGIFIILLCFLFKVNSYAAELNVYVDDTYMSENFGQYKYYAIVTDGAGNYATIYSDGQIISTGTTIHSLLTNGYYGFNTMKIEDDYLVIDENGKSYNTWSSVTVQLNSLNIGYTSSINQIIWSNVDIYKTVFSNTGSPSASDEVIHSVTNNIGAKPVEEPLPDVPDNIINVSVDLTEVIKLMESIELCCKSIFSIISMVLFFLVAEWTANKIKNVVRRFSRYE